MPSPSPGRRVHRGEETIDIAVSSSVCSTLDATFGIEPAGLGVRGHRLLVEPAVTARVDEAGEELRVVAVADRLASRRTSACSRVSDVRFEVGVELVRDRQPRVELERATERLLGALFAVGHRLMNLPMTRWQRPSRAHAGAKLGSSSRQRS